MNDIFKCLIASLALASLNQAGGQSCGRSSSAKIEPVRIENNGYSVVSQFAGQLEFESQESYPKFYRRISYSGGWRVAESRVAYTCSQTFSSGTPVEVTFSGYDQFSSSDGAASALNGKAVVSGYSSTSDFETAFRVDLSPTVGVFPGSGYIRPYVQVLGLGKQSALRREYNVLPSSECSGDQTRYQIGSQNLGIDALFGRNFTKSSVVVNLSQEDSVATASNYAVPRGGSKTDNYSGNTASVQRELNENLQYENNGRWFTAKVVKKTYYFKPFGPFELKQYENGCGSGSRHEFKISAMVSGTLTDSKVSINQEGVIADQNLQSPVKSIRFDRTSGDLEVDIELVAESTSKTLEEVSVEKTSYSECDADGGEQTAKISSVDWSVALGKPPHARLASYGSIGFYMEDNVFEGFDHDYSYSYLTSHIPNFSYSSYSSRGNYSGPAARSRVFYSLDEGGEIPLEIIYSNTNYDPDSGYIRQIKTDKALIDIKTSLHEDYQQYDASLTYADGDLVLYDDKVYESRYDSNLNNTPVIDGALNYSYWFDRSNYIDSSKITINFYDIENLSWDEDTYTYISSSDPFISYVIDQDSAPDAKGIRFRKFVDGVLDQNEEIRYIPYNSSSSSSTRSIRMIHAGGDYVEQKMLSTGRDYQIGSFDQNEQFEVDRSWSDYGDTRMDYEQGSSVRLYTSESSTISNSLNMALEVESLNNDETQVKGWRYTNYGYTTSYDQDIIYPWKNSEITYLGSSDPDESLHDVLHVNYQVYDNTSNGDADGYYDRYDLVVREVLGSELYRKFDVNFSKRISNEESGFPIAALDGSVMIDMKSEVTIPPTASWDDVAVHERVTYYVDANADRRYAGLPICEIDLAEDQIALYRYPEVADAGHHVVVKYEGRVGIALDRNTIPDPTDFVSGSISTTHYNSTGELCLKTIIDIQSGQTIYSKSAAAFEESDPEKRPTRYDYLDGTYETMTYTCCGVDLAQDRQGNVTDYDYDELKHLEYVTSYLDTPHQFVTYYKRNSVGDILETWVGPDRENLVLSASEAFDLAGETVQNSEWFLDEEAAGSDEVEGYSYSSYSQPYVDTEGYVVQQITYCNGNQVLSAVTEKYFKDGRLYERFGNAINGGVRYNYTIETDSDLGYAVRVVKEIVLDPSGAETGIFTKTYTDAYGRNYKVERPSAAVEGEVVRRRLYYAGASDRIVKLVDFDGTVTLYDQGFDPSIGEYVIQVLDADGSGDIEMAGEDRIVRRSTQVASRTEDAVDYTVQRTKLEVWPDSGASPEVVTTSDQGLDGLVSWTHTYNQTVATSVDLDVTNATQTVTSESNLGRRRIETYVDGLLMEQDESELDSAPGELVSSMTYAYGDLRRLQTLTDNLRSTTSTYGYYQDGRVKRFTPPIPDAATTDGTPEALPTDYQYEWPFAYGGHTGLLESVDFPDGTSAKRFLLQNGRLRASAQSDSTQLDLLRVTSLTDYDYAGRVKALTTFQDASQDASGVVTAWEYNHVGLLRQKWYDATIANNGSISGTEGPQFTYTAEGRLATRLNARGTSATYQYDANTADLTGIAYDDGLTSPVNYSEYDRLGRVTEITDDSGTRSLDFEAGRLTDETYTSGPLSGYVLIRHLDGLDRFDQIILKSGAIDLHQVDYGYDNASRLHTVAGNGSTVTYAYDPSSELRQARTYNNGSSDVLDVEMRYDNLNRLRSISTLDSSAGVLNAYSYLYDNLNRRVVATDSDDNYWNYTYDDLGQVDSAEKYNNIDAAIPGYSFGFTFDDIGNRTQATTNGRIADYTPDNFNQYDEREVPRALDIRGSGVTGSTVTVNSQVATRQGETFHHSLDLSAGGNGAQQVDILVAASLPDGGDNNAPRIADAEKSEYLPANPVSFLHDHDGNLTDDGHWHYTWDAENRLITMEILPVAYSAGASRQKLEFDYDSQGRRFSKKVYDWNLASSAYLLVSHFLCLYDGWNLIAELDALQTSPFTLQTSYVWGLDLSGSLQGAGGVGGLLSVADVTNSTFYPAYDGNGNVMGYYAADTGESVAEFEYGPFGELIRATGSKKDDFNFRFSTKYEDSETGLLYYGFRYYDAATGRWLSRDPIGERGGLNLYGMVGNDPLNYIDILGLDKLILTAQFKCVNGQLNIQFGNMQFIEENIFFDDVVDIPGFTEFNKDGIFQNIDGSIIALDELVDFANSGGFETSGEFKDAIVDLGNQPALKNDYFKYLNEINGDPYYNANTRAFGRDFINGMANSYLTSVALSFAGSVGLTIKGVPLGDGLQAVDIAKGRASEALRDRAESVSTPSDCCDLISNLKDAGWYGIREYGSRVEGKFEVFNDLF